VLAVALALGALAAAEADGPPPAAALRSEWLYRLEVAGAVAGLIGLILLAGWMAWRGQPPRRVELPGGAAVETGARELDGATDWLSDFQVEARDRLEELEEAVFDLDERVRGLESRVP
jgi:hypothetical protein